MPPYTSINKDLNYVFDTFYKEGLKSFYDSSDFNKILNTTNDERNSKGMYIEKHHIYEENNDECLIKFPVTSILPDTLKVEVDPYERHINISGKIKYDSIVDNSENERDYTYKLLINSKKWDLENPTATYLKQGVLYIKFKKYENLNKKTLTVDMS